MVTITRAKTGKTTFKGESFSEFKKRQRAKKIARRRGQESLARRLQETRDPKQVKALTQVSISEVKEVKPKKIIGKQVLRVIPKLRLRKTIRTEPIKTPDALFKPVKLQTISKQKLKKIPKARIEPVTRKKSIIEKLGLTREEQLKKISQIEKSKKGDIRKGAEKAFVGTVGLGAVGVVRGAESFFKAIKNPKKFVKEQVEFAKAFKNDPRGVSRELSKQFEQDPAGFITEFITFSKTTGFTGKTIQKSPVGRLAAEEIFIAQQPKKLRPGVRAVIKSSKAQEKIGFVGEKPKKIDFMDVKEITPTEAKIIKKTLQQTDSIVFGSKAATSLTKGKTKIPKDVDLATSDVGKFNKAFIENLPKSQRKNYKISKEKIVRISDGTKILDVKPTSRLIPDKGRITKKGQLPITGEKKKFRIGEQVRIQRDIDNINKDLKILKDPKKIKQAEKQLKGLKKELTETKKKSELPLFTSKLITDAFTPTQKLQKVEGIKLVGLGEQTTRKGLGTLQVLLEKNPRRAKDPAAFIESLEIQLSNIKKSKPKTPIGEIQKKSKIKKIESGLKVLKSKEFAALLNKKVPGLTKEFPLIPKIEAKKLKAAQKIRDKQTIDVIQDIKEFKFVDLSKPKKKTPPKIEKPSRLPSKPSKLPVKPSRLPKISKIPSKIIKPSIIPSKPSKTPKKPSKVPIKPSKTPTISKFPSNLIKPSVVPSALPSKLSVSKLPKGKASKLLSKLPKKTPLSQVRIFQITKKQKKKIIKKKVKKQKLTITKFTTTITRPEKGKGKGLRIGDIELFTGAELR